MLRIKDIAENGVSATDLILIMMVMVIWEIAKELVKLVLVEKIREGCGDMKMCCRSRKTGKKKTAIIYMIDLKAKAHKCKTCKALKNTTKEIKEIELCTKCETQEELDTKEA